VGEAEILFHLIRFIGLRRFFSGRGSDNSFQTTLHFFHWQKYVRGALSYGGCILEAEKLTNQNWTDNTRTRYENWVKVDPRQSEKEGV